MEKRKVKKVTVEYEEGEPEVAEGPFRWFSVRYIKETPKSHVAEIAGGPSDFDFDVFEREFEEEIPVFSHTHRIINRRVRTI